ncbi:A-type inclusion protein [Equine molluscum contagiosum-like virus]|nr:A-type inclusion protein [Equine molluscum contagiosum-like virus]
MGAGFDAGSSHALQVFTQLVDSSWGDRLSTRSCLSRRARKAVRNVFRALMFAASQESEVLYPGVLQNSFFEAMIAYDNSSLRRRYEQLDAHSERLPYVIDTVGKYVLYFVVETMLCAGLRTAPEPDSVEKALSALLQMAFRVHYVQRCKYMFIGAPAYLVRYLTANASVRLLNGLSDLTMTTDTGEHLSWRGAEGYADIYLEYLIFLGALAVEEGVAAVSLRRGWVTIDTRVSIPEFVMEALGFSARDEVRVAPEANVRVYVSENADGTYSYFDLQGRSLSAGVPLSYDDDGDVSAVAILSAPESEDVYRHRLFTPAECGAFVFHEDSYATPRHDYDADPRLLADLSLYPSARGDVLPVDDEFARGHHEELLEDVHAFDREIRDYIQYVQGLRENAERDYECLQIVQTQLREAEARTEALRRGALALAQKANALGGALGAAGALDAEGFDPCAIH